MSATRGMLRSLAVTCGSPAEVLNKLNRLMVEDFPPGRFVTLIYAVLDPANRMLRFASAGHLPPLLMDDAGSRFLPKEEEPPVGLVAGEFSETTVELRQGSRLLFYSDGITEAAAWGDQEYGPRRLQSHLLTSDPTTESILSDVRFHVDGTGLQDDAAVILLRA